MNHPLEKFENLICPCSDEQLEAMAAESRMLTLRNFGSTMRLFAPLYLSNECVNVCRYCGFSRDNPILRVRLTPEQVGTEARHLMEQGFRSILLVAGEHPKFVGEHYLVECVRRLRNLELPSVHLEVGPMETEKYRSIVEAGAEGLVVYQETYDRKIYAHLHVAGPKRDFDWRMACPDRAYAAGFRRIGIGVLFGLADWRADARALAGHLDELLKRCWKAFFTVSLPRLRPIRQAQGRPADGEFQPFTKMSDRDLAQAVFALRICFPQVGIVLSTRESPRLRDGLARLGITMMSAGSHTEPGGYTGAGKEDLHLTTRGNRQPAPSELIRSEGEHATEQFVIADDRPVDAVVNRLRQMGCDPVWKDWDAAIFPDAH
ncbi:MAG: 2-iminoacetate synthase ThiH [Verrucomicrobia bacterium]|nr:2-iminoacetate synthase ThiH [Verrucomicrobiota bacterium]